MPTTTRRQFIRNGTAAVVAASTLGSANAQSDWPAREVHAVCSFPPGTGADIFVRFYAKKLQDVLGKPVIVENKIGAFGNIALEYVAKSKPDGYTIGIVPGSAFAAASVLFKKLPFDPLNDFEHVARLSKLPFVMVVAADSPYKTLADLTAFLKTKGEDASYGSLTHIGVVASELYKAQFGLKAVEVKYKENPSLLNDLYASNIAFAYFDATVANALIQSGKVRGLATSAAEPTSALPNVLSAKQAGILNSNLLSWWSVLTPKGVPAPILQRLEAVFQDIAVAEDTKAFLRTVAGDPYPGSSKEVKELLASELKVWQDYAKLAKIEAM